ncbi:iron complex transport system ATP-binding protein [Nonomuraea fuscirosea]|uniref:Iron complex transport system ATP-binding protein n=1 Tax=Nonomuraea fuscirosea TaxID=1291556 RepID=A0A2T0MT88_9ACTN|nr:ABC transporter ATP-binding protein [Nonomuraea fuscirosea]PRX61817.1 iron complex transport system ATP-binding protein [Nonomuraea fuscirosea]
MTEEISLRGAELSLSYHGTTVVEDGRITLRPGHVTALVGPNGSGKSTLLRALARLHRPDGGTVTLADGTSALGLSARDFARRVTLLAQSRPTPGGVQVRDVVGYGRHPYRRRWKAGDPDGAAAVARAMELTGVTTMAERPVDELSGGELQRVWLATCLAQDTGVLLLDEPTTFLDLRYQVELLELIRDLADEHGVAIGVVLHDLNQAAEIADHVVLLHQGRVRADGPPALVLTEDLLTAAYGIRIEVSADPITGTVITRPIGRHNTSGRQDAGVSATT